MSPILTQFAWSAMSEAEITDHVFAYLPRWKTIRVLPLTPEQEELHNKLDELALRPFIKDRNTGEPYATGLGRTVTDEEHAKNIKAMIS